MRLERLRQGSVVVLGLMAALSFACQAFGQLEGVPWEQLPERIAGRLLSVEELAVADCPKGIERSPHARVVLQYIENTLYEWNEYEIVGADGKALRCIVMVRPEAGPLSQCEAQVLLSASRLWIEPLPDPADRTALPAWHPSLDRLPVRPSRKPPPPSREPSGEPGGLAASGILQEDDAHAGIIVNDVINADDRVRITATTEYPYNTLCFAAFEFGSLPYRGTAFLVSPYVAITAAHNVFDFDRLEWATNFVVAPGQRQFVADGTVDRPYGTRTAVSMRTDPAYMDAADLEYDYGAVMFSTPFTSISTFMPLVFDNEPAYIFTAGYPPEVQDETSSQALWQSEGDVLGVGGVGNRLLFVEADVSVGNSGGPMWYKASPEAAPRVVGVLTFGAGTYNGGALFVTQNQTLINEWVEWTPPADDNYEENDTRLAAYDFSSRQQTWLSEIDGSAVQADDDWYRIQVIPGKENVIVDCRFTHSEGDIDVQLLSSTGNLLAFAKTATDNEYIDTVVPIMGTYYILVHFQNAGNAYDLWWHTMQPAVPPDLPIITGLTPTSGPVFALAKIEGSNFGIWPGDVQFSGAAAVVISWSDTLIECRVSGGTITGDVYVRDSRGHDSNTVTYSVTTPDTINVINTGSVAGIENGSALYPFSTIQRGIDSCADGATVVVADGVYTGVGNRDIDFKGKAIHLRSAKGARNSIINCQGTEQEPHRGFIFASGEGGSSILDGFTITGAYAGSGVSCTNSSPTIANNIIAGNTGPPGTGGISCIGSSAVITGNVIADNTATSGGGIYLSGGTAVVTGNTISANTADVGGGIAIDSASPTITNSIISANTVLSGLGGGIYAYNSSPLITNNTIVDNRSTGQQTDGSDSAGGGVYAGAGGTLTLDNCIVRNNIATSGSEVALGAPVVLTVRYANIAGGAQGVAVEAGSTLNWGEGNVEQDPLFADPGYWDDNGTPGDTGDDIWIDGAYHVRSRYGRWDSKAGGGVGAWVSDSATSLCIDAGNPASNYSNEPSPNFGRVNIGAHGNTEGASKSGWNLPGDVTGDCRVDVLDMIHIRNKLNDDTTSADNWQADVTLDGYINILDMIFVSNRARSQCK
ncbi:MAG: hypothetical protein HQ592_17270 [Planctomycetes bacterium]|nr:hypothetical protein [Planctomycetota bacterium]